MKLLVVNDDGIDAIGLKILVDTLKDFGEVVVFAPAKCESAQSQKITIHTGIKVETINSMGVEAYAVHGSAADCVRLGCFLNPDINIVLSGVNNGLNLGHDLFYSSTVAAILQAGLLGKRGIALSCDKNYDYLKGQLIPILNEYLVNNEKHGQLLNINLPISSYNTYKGIVNTIGGNRRFENDFKIVDGMYVDKDLLINDMTPGTDSEAVTNGMVSVTTLSLNRTI